ncbi:hypothetical protein [Consotaella salsifontis]|uniref:hypothetical protein n=1 Tax=Consotaella salsifontis TaxID=1365950 RepID=UPI0009993CA8|nr:hypothetical protein [Consotaella salsifontis]
MAHHAEAQGAGRHHPDVPAGAPDSNPIEAVWQFTRYNSPKNRVFLDCDDILVRCREAWNKLADQPSKIISISAHVWAYEF